MQRLIESSSIEEGIQALLGSNVHIVKRSPVGGGCISRASALHLSDGTTLFLKENHNSSGDLFRCEVEGLTALRTEKGPRVPRPFIIHSGGRFLAMEYIGSGTPGPGFAEALGRSLAEMHRAIRNERCGFRRDNYIGVNPQQNGWLPRWTDFFADRRLEFQLRLAQRNGLADADLSRGVESIMARISKLLVEPEGGASLLHGDLWSGNYIVDESGRPVLIDPAVYYGHREADLAMTELFGTPGRRFYSAYEEVWPLQPGYSDRRDLYNLYHLLNHLNLFGRSYEGSVRSIVRRYR